MRAITYEAYGSPDVLRLREIEKPIAGDDEVLVRIRAASAGPFDWHCMRGVPYVIRVTCRRSSSLSTGITCPSKIYAMPNAPATNVVA